LVGELLEIILKRLSQQQHLIVASRTIPTNLPLVLLTAQGQIVFMGQNDLAFAGDEVQEILKRKHNLDLTPEQAGELVVTSEGWITGILLATASMWRGMRDVLAQARAQEEPVYTYLADQAFEEQPQALRETMLTISTLPEMNEALCRQVLGLSGANDVLRELERRGLFLTTVVDEAGVRYYRYHHLFRDFLQARLRNQNPARFCCLHQQAADWFEANEQWVRAVVHRQTAGDPRATAQTMENGAKAMFLSGRLETLVAWYEDIPKSLRPEFPCLLLYAAWALIDLGRADEALPPLHQAEATFSQRNETEQSLFAVVRRATVRYGQGRYTEALRIARDVLQAANSSVLTAEAHRLTGLACLDLGQPEKSVQHLQTALDLYEGLGANEITVTYLDLSFALLRLGRLSEGWTCQDKAIELYRSMGPSAALAITLNNVACERYYLMGHYDQALAYLRESLDVAWAAGSPRARAVALLSTADLYCDLGALQKAQELYSQAKEIARRSGYATQISFALLGTAQALARADNVVEALGLAAQARDQAERRGDIYQSGLGCLTLGAAHLKAGDPQTALSEIERGRDQLAQSGARRDLVRAYVLLARAHQAVGDTEDALQALSKALEMGIETQSYHYLVVEGQRAFDLFKQLQQRNPADRRLTDIMNRVQALPDAAREVLGGLVPTALPQRPALRFYGFGPGRVEKDNRSVVWKSNLARYLAFYFLLHSPRNRDQIGETFWPQVSRARATSSFHSAKHSITRSLGRALIAHEKGLYRTEWGPDCWFDVTVFESLLDGYEGSRQTRLKEATSLYRGDFLEGYDAEWCLSTRERLRMRYRDALVELGELYMQEKAFADSRSVLKQALTVDRLHEPSVRALMRLHAFDGRPHAAMDLFRRLRRQLQRELDAPPEQETQSLYQAIQSGNFVPPSKLA
jgi:ATP/maltotriose-dependent transcriptional regulator MalT/DNA-binding SARP family transcriptional activator